VDNARLVRRGEGLRNLHADLEDYIELKRFPMREMLTQGLAFDQLGGDIVLAVYLTDLINGQNVGVIECGSCLGFLNKTIQLVCVLAEFFVEKFDSDFAVQFCVLGQVHLTHPARADFGDDAVVQQSGVG
jgi:hypothetical protein